jgi:hypothetical protein
MQAHPRNRSFSTSTRAGRSTSMPGPMPEEAAAIVAALERFMRETAPAAGTPAMTAADPWRQAAVQEGLDRAKRHDLRDPWINT